MSTVALFKPVSAGIKGTLTKWSCTRFHECILKNKQGKVDETAFHAVSGGRRGG